MTARQACWRALARALIAIGAAIALCPAAADSGPPATAASHLTMTLMAEHEQVRAGDSVTLALRAMPQPGWHGYWENPGDAGFAAKFTWTLPRGATVGPVRYPVPGRLLIAGLMNYVYDQPYAPLVELQVPAGLAIGTALPIAVRADYLVCSHEVCVPESQTLALRLTVGGAAGAPRPAFDAFRRALPRPLAAVASFARENGRFRLSVPFPAAAPANDAYFYPLTTGALDYAAPQSVSRVDDRLIVETKAGSGTPNAVAGVLAIDGQGFAIQARPGVVEAAPVAASSGMWQSALVAFAGAVLGGLTSTSCRACSRS